MNEKLLMETVALAGKIMLSSGSDSYRIEDTMKFMLQKSHYPITEVIVFATGIFLTLYDPERETLTITMRIPARSTNINRICRVNDLSRRFCRDEISLEDTFAELQEVEKQVLYSKKRKMVGTIGVAAFFAPIFGGNLWDMLGAGIVGAILAISDQYVKRIRLNDFFTNAFGAFVVSVAASVVAVYVIPPSHSNVMTMSTIMTLVPGVAFTTAIRDTLNGDYTTGASRMLEAIVVALAVAAGVGIGLVFWQLILSGGLSKMGAGTMLIRPMLLFGGIGLR